MASKRFRPRELQKDSDLEDVRRQLNQVQVEIGRDLDTLFAGGTRETELITATSYAASFGDVARFAPPSAGVRLILPEPNLAVPNGRVTAVSETAGGDIVVEVVNGTINGAATLTYTAAVRVVEFVLTPAGWYAAPP